METACRYLMENRQRGWALRAMTREQRQVAAQKAVATRGAHGHDVHRRRAALRGTTASQALDRLGLSGIYSLIKRGELHQAIEQAYAELATLNERLDAFEAEHPEVAERLPWRDAREAWKTAGRPQPPWWEALQYGSHWRDWKPPWPHTCQIPWMKHADKGPEHVPKWVVKQDPCYYAFANTKKRM